MCNLFRQLYKFKNQCRTIEPIYNKSKDIQKKKSLKLIQNKLI